MIASKEQAADAKFPGQLANKQVVRAGIIQPQ
jgi:hypothetical protein